MEEAEDFKCIFVVHCVLKQNRLALFRELLNNNLLFVGQLYEDKSLVLCAHDLIFFTTDLQTVIYLELIFFFIIASFCSLEGQFESKIDSWKIRNRDV